MQRQGRAPSIIFRRIVAVVALADNCESAFSLGNTKQDSGDPQAHKNHAKTPKLNQATQPHAPYQRAHQQTLGEEATCCLHRQDQGHFSFRHVHRLELNVKSDTLDPAIHKAVTE